MATGTYTYGDIMATISATFSRTLEAAQNVTVANIAQNLIWMAFDWPNTIVTLPPFWLVAGNQDHGPPQVAVPRDYQGLRECRCVQLNSSEPRRTPVSVQKDLQLTDRMNLPERICYKTDIKSFRVYPRVPLGIGAPFYLIEGTYKKLPTLVTNQTYNATVLWTDDIYIQTWIESFKYALMLLANNEKAGMAQVLPNGAVSYTGQLANAMAAIQKMAADVGINLGDVSISPGEPLVNCGGNWGSGIPIFF